MVLGNYDGIIVGAGAAGLICAASAAQRGRSVLLLDHARKVGEKIRISGGGRCNFTNLHAGPGNFISANPHFCKSALSRFTQHDFIAMVDRHGIAWHEKTLGQLFCDGSSQQIINMLVAECKDVKIMAETAITRIEKTSDGFRLETTKGECRAPALVIATGGLSIPKMGATGFGYDVARQFGLNVIEPRAALVPLTFSEQLLAETKPLSGLSVGQAEVSCNGVTFREGLLFTHRGLSGPVILQISSYWKPADVITVNLCPDTDAMEFLKKARQDSPKKMLHTVLSDLLPQRVAEMIAGRFNYGGTMADLSDAKLQPVSDAINRWCVKPQGSEGFRTAEVTRGGVDTDELSSKTCESRKIPGLYFIGEVVDVTGWLGGYNFQWAWSSGWCCGQSI